MEEISTAELVEKLREREGVEVHIAEPYKDFGISIQGPAIVLIITD